VRFRSGHGAADRRWRDARCGEDHGGKEVAMRFRVLIVLTVFVLFLSACAKEMTASLPAAEVEAPVAVQAATAVEGMWPLDGLDDSVFDQMRDMGFELSRADLYNPNGTGVAYAVVDLGGGTGSFVSPKGLILTNHHVALMALQRASAGDADHNYIEAGINARSYAEEIPAEGYRASVLMSIRDVTDEVLGAASEEMGGFERFEAIERRIKEIVAEAEEGRDVECEVVEFYSGMQYKLFTSFTIKDIRLVYAPPQAIGNYGGDIDNWMWPRHTGDFSFFRAYVAPDGSSAEYAEENVPYEPAVFLPVSNDGVREGDFTMIIGFPGQTLRYRTSYSIDHHQNFNYPTRIKLFGDIIAILQEAAAGDPEVAVKVASLDAMLNNAVKNYEGQLEGFTKARLFERKVQQEREFSAWLDRNPGMKEKYGDILPRIGSLYDEYVKKTREKSQITRFVGFGSQMVRAASTLYRWSLEKAKDDLEREPGYQERDIPQLTQGLRMIERSYDQETDRKVLRYFMLRALELPAGQRIEAYDAWMARMPGENDESKVDALLDKLCGGTKLGSTEERMRMFELSHDELMKEGDSFIEFVAELYPELEELENRDKEFNGAVTAIRPRLIEAYKLWKGGALYPDANGTIRLTYGTVQGYSPRDAVDYYYITSLSGMVEKHTGEDPFDAPKKLLDLAMEKRGGRYIDKVIRDVPVDFLSTCDITGGNSGSPILNARGEVIGTAFDGNWESISSDYLFNSKVTRAISVDSRYILFILERFSGAERVLDEMLIR
jgi:hypothetical protein